MEKDTVAKYWGVSPEVESNTRWSSVWRLAVKEQRCLDNCDALLIIAEYLTISSPHTQWTCFYECILLKETIIILIWTIKASVLLLCFFHCQHQCVVSFFMFLSGKWRFRTRQKSQRPAVWNVERIWSSRPAICSPERGAWDLINMATVDGECGCCGFSRIDWNNRSAFGSQRNDHWGSSLCTPLFLSTVLIKELGNRIP